MPQFGAEHRPVLRLCGDLPLGMTDLLTSLQVQEELETKLSLNKVWSTFHTTNFFSGCHCDDSTPLDRYRYGTGWAKVHGVVPACMQQVC